MEINLREVIKSKSPGAARWIPAPLLRYLTKTIHEDEVNYILRTYSHLAPFDFIAGSLMEMGVKYTVRGLDKIDPASRPVFVSNHPFGGLDGVMEAEAIGRHMGGVKVIVNDLLLNLAPLAPIFIPVNKHGRQNTQNSRLFREAFESDTAILSFPSGLCSRRTNGVVRDKPWKANFVKMAVEYRRDIVPVFIEGQLSNFFYRLANLRTKLGIKANIEMLYLVDEMFAQRGHNFDIIVGNPIPYAEFANKKPIAAAREIEDIVYGLSKK